MKEGRDFSLVYHINERYKELKPNLDSINSLNDFSNSGLVRKAILFDFFQIGELLNHLSKEFKESFGMFEIESIVSMRNRIVHGYAVVKDELIYHPIKEKLPDFINRLNSFAQKRYKVLVKTLIGKTVRVLLDEDNKNMNYKAGYIEDLTMLNGRFQDAYYFGDTKSLSIISGVVSAIAHKKSDDGDMVIVTEAGTLDSEHLKPIDIFTNCEILTK